VSFLEKKLYAVSVLLFSLGPGAVNSAALGGELVLNSDFTERREGGPAAHWSTASGAWSAAECGFKWTDRGVLVEPPPGRPYAVGRIRQTLKGVQGGKAYAFEALCRATGIEEPYRSILFRAWWTRRGRRFHPAGFLVRGPFICGEEIKFQDVLKAPVDADGAVISLELKWPLGGSVLWKRVSVRLTEPPPRRTVKIGTVYLRPRGSSPGRNLKLFCDKIDEAGKLGLDIVCLGEAIKLVGTQASVADCAEPIPGPATKMIGEAARRNSIWVVAGLNERSGGHLYNTAVLFDRRGRIAGTYRKVHLPREEWTEGVTPGTTYPVFQTDFGKVAVQICYDWFFPETTAILALKGAEIILSPTWGNTLPDEDGRVRGETVFRVRARDNGVYMVPSVYGGNSMVIDPLGKILASSNGREGVFWAQVDLSRRDRLSYVGYWRSIGPRHRMPGTYVPLLRKMWKPTY